MPLDYNELKRVSKYPDKCPWQEKFEKAKKEAKFAAMSRDHAWAMLQTANRRLRNAGLQPVANPQEMP